MFSAEFGRRQITFLLHIVSQERGRWFSWDDWLDSIPLAVGPALVDTSFEAWCQAQNWMQSVLASGQQMWAVGDWFEGSLSERAFQLITNAAIHHEQFICRDDREYPLGWRHQADGPLAVHVRGDVNLLGRPSVAVVGARRASQLALDVGFRIGHSLANSGVVVASGGAIGCDTAAHLGAVSDAGAAALTVVVQASGLNRLYPQSNIALFDRVVRRGGAIISERLPDQVARPWDFIARNRLISGMSSETVVLQAARKSGAMVTARHAIAQGHDVYVLRHPEYDVRAEGNRWLLAEGAHGFLSAEEYLRGEQRDSSAWVRENYF